MIHLDTSFIIDFIRERRRGVTGPAGEFFARLPSDERAGISLHAACELYVGVAMSTHPEAELRWVEDVLSVLAPVELSEDFAPTYGRLFATLNRRGTTVATMDLLIGTAAVCASAPLVTGNPKHFTPIEGLEVMSYRDSR